MIVRIGLSDIGAGHPTYVIAEIGSNHGGSLGRAFTLIEAAADAGADCAKFQLYREHELYPGRSTPYALPDEWLPELQHHAHEIGLEFICSVFSTETLAAYMEISPPAIKIASPEATDLNLIDMAAETGLPLLIATGACDWQQVADIALVAGHALDRTILLHCVSSYPAPAAELNLSVLTRMRTDYGLVGFSDHTYEEHTAPMVAVAVGACVIEKHLTFSHYSDTPDAPFALEPDGFRRMVEMLRLTERMLGDGDKRPMPSEDPTDRR